MNQEPNNGGPMTLDKLAEMIQNNVAKKEDLALLATKEDIKKLATKEELNAVREELRNEITRLHADVVTKHDLIDEVKKLNFAVEIDTLEGRMKRVEQKLGLVQA
jgi:hypothetical protein